MALKLSSTRIVIGSVFLGADEIFGSDAFTMVYCTCAKVIEVTPEVIDASIQELTEVLKSDQASRAAEQLSDCGDYELISEGKAAEDIAEILLALQLLVRDYDTIDKDDETLRTRVRFLQKSMPNMLH